MVALIGLGLLLLYPSIQWYSTDTVDRDRLEAARQQPTWLINLGLDLRGGTHLLRELETEKLPPNVSAQEGLNQALGILRNRVDQFGVAEPFIARQGARWIVVQLPGLTNAAQAKALAGRTALLEFRLVDNSVTAQQALRQTVALGHPFENGQLKATVARRSGVSYTLLGRIMTHISPCAST
jgi:preprotein translocase subunit SecD